MIPLPSLDFTGGAGGAATAGTQTGQVPWSNAFGSYQVGGMGNTGGGGTASAGASAGLSWLPYALLGVGALLLLLLLPRRK